MIKRAWTWLFILFLVIGFSGIADAKLIKIGTAVINNGGAEGGGMGGPAGSGMPMGSGMQGGAVGSSECNLIYEDDQGLIWLDYTSRSGRNWDGVVSWAAGLNDKGALTIKPDPGVSVSWEGDWRLPKTKDGARRFGYDGTTTAGFNITTSELGYLYYVSLGNLGYYDKNGNPTGEGWYPDSAWGPKNMGPFKNLQASVYWSSEYSIAPLHAWSFNLAFGDQNNTAFKTSYPYLGIAVRPAKVTFTAAKER